MTDDTDEDKNVLPFRVVSITDDDETYADLDCDLVLDGAKGKLSRVLLIGFNTDDNLYMAMSQGSVAENLLLLEYARIALNDHMMP
jgi:hypothetical protein